MTKLLLVLALLPGLLLLFFVYKQDKIEKEPMSLVMKLLGLGALSVIPVIIVELIMEAVLKVFMYEESLMFKIAENFLGIALIEEGFKLLFLRLGSWKNKNFDYRFDGVVYAVSVSMGFVLLENVMYVFENGLGTAIVRAITSLPGHCIFGIYMGYFYGEAKRHEVEGRTGMNSAMMLLCLFVPTTLHGFYDFFLSLENWLAALIFLFFVIVLDAITLVQLKKYANADMPFTQIATTVAPTMAGSHVIYAPYGTSDATMYYSPVVNRSETFVPVYEAVKPAGNVTATYQATTSAESAQSVYTPVESVESTNSVYEPIKPVENTNAVYEPVKPVGNADSVYEPVKAVENIDSVYEPIKPVENADSVYEPVKPVENANSVYEPIKPVENTNSVYEPIKPVENTSSVYELVKSADSIYNSEKPAESINVVEEQPITSARESEVVQQDTPVILETPKIPEDHPHRKFMRPEDL